MRLQCHGVHRQAAANIQLVQIEAKIQNEHT